MLLYTMFFFWAQIIVNIRRVPGGVAVLIFARSSWFGFQDLVLAVIGEMFEEPNVVGIGMAIRSREDLLSVWNEDNSNDQVHTAVLDTIEDRWVQRTCLRAYARQQPCRSSDDLSRGPRPVLVLH